MRHVLEHLADPIASLTKVEKALSENGLFYVAVPNNMKPKGSLERYWYRAVHTYYFNRVTLEYMCRKVGLEPILIIEGDELSKHELVLVCQKNRELAPPSIDPQNYAAQRSVIKNHSSMQNSILTKLRRFSARLFLAVKNRKN